MLTIQLSTVCSARVLEQAARGRGCAPAHPSGTPTTHDDRHHDAHHDQGVARRAGNSRAGISPTGTVARWPAASRSCDALQRTSSSACASARSRPRARSAASTSAHVGAQRGAERRAVAPPTLTPRHHLRPTRRAPTAARRGPSSAARDPVGGTSARVVDDVPDLLSAQPVRRRTRCGRSARAERRRGVGAAGRPGGRTRRCVPWSRRATESAILQHGVHLVGDEEDGQVQVVAQLPQQRRRSRRSPRGRARTSPRRRAAPTAAGPAPGRCRPAGAGRRRAGAGSGRPGRPARRGRAARRRALASRRAVTPRYSSGSATFSAAVRRSSSPSDWKTVPMRRRATRSLPADSVVRSSPLTTTEPEVGGVSRVMHCASVLLPAPLGPTTARISPASTRKLTPSSTTVRWSPRP